MAKKATIKITSDTKEAESGLDKVSAKINQFSNNNKQSLGGLSRLNGAITNAAKSFGAVGVAAGVSVALAVAVAVGLTVGVAVVFAVAVAVGFGEGDVFFVGFGDGSAEGISATVPSGSVPPTRTPSS